jgi:phosphatidylserine/phosphatidylglycerophosphate/cardiolipin synthase-like enzyme
MKPWVLVFSLWAAMVHPSFGQAPSRTADPEPASANRQDFSTAEELFFPYTPEPGLPPGVTVLFSPKDEIQAEVVRLIGSAKNEILFSQYAITNVAIFNALKAARARNVAIIGILEAHPNLQNYNSPEILRAARIPILYARAAKGWNNHKFAIIDRSTVLTGSFDWTRSANTNAENLLVVTEAGVAARFMNAWVSQAKTCGTYKQVFSQGTP